jgi:carboxyl-terminal processing protease
MKGKPGTKVTVTIYREGTGMKDYVLTRATITLKTVSSEMLKDKIGYLRITTFDENTADAFNSNLNSLLNQGMKGLIIDLRDNPGGLLDTSTRIADRLLGKGTIVYTIDGSGKREDWYSDAKSLNLPLVLLVNEGSASASEILSGAVRDFKAGTLIGTKTFGKGLVQNVLDLKDGQGSRLLSQDIIHHQVSVFRELV